MSDSIVIEGGDARRAARNVGALVIASIISKGALFVWQLALFAMLGVGDYGIYGTVGGLMVIGGSITGFGMSLIAIRDVAREPSKAGRYWSAMLFWQTALALLAYIGINAFSAVYDETLRAFVALAGINLFIDLFGNTGYDLLLSREDMVKTSAVEIAHILLRIGLSLLALWLGWGLLGIYGAAILSGGLRSIALFGLNLRAGIRPVFPIERDIRLPMLINSAPLAISAILTVAYQQTDKLMTTGILGVEGTGYLTVAFMINFGIIEVLSVTVLVAAYPMLSRYYGAGQDPRFGFMIEKLALFTIVMALPMALVVSMLSLDVITALFGAENAASARILSILIWYTAITMVANIFSQGLLVQNRQRLLLGIRASGLLLNIALNAILLASWGDPRGAAVASVISETLLLSLLLWTFRAHGYAPRRLFRGAIRLILLGLPVALLMFALHAAHAIAVAVGGPLAFLLGLRLANVFAADDLDLMHTLAAAMPGGALITRFWKRTGNQD